MPLVEFAGVSGVGKTTLLDRLFRLEKLQHWNNDNGPNPRFDEPHSRTSEDLTGTLLKLWHAKAQHISCKAETEDMKSLYLSVASWHLRWDQTFPHHHSSAFTAIDEHFLQLLFPELCWLVQTQPEEARHFLEPRNFLLLTDDPENILTRVRERQVTGTARPHLDGDDDTKILADSKSFQSAMLSFLQQHEHFGYNWLVIDMSKGFDAALAQALAFMLGLENMYKAASSPSSAS